MDTETPIDVWLKFENEGDEEPILEANTFERDGRFVIEWYHVDVGQVTSKEFDTLADAHAWYEKEGFANFTA